MTDVHRHLGIPYAHAARFAAPEFVGFEPARDTSTFGPAAPQALDSPLGELVPGMRVTETDEDACLTLNVWAPAAPGPHPVLVWFHGGSFVMGGSAQPVYDGARLAAEQSVVVVSANYRLGAFGFLDARRFGGVANCGVRDAQCALRWVNEHIESFGGDPARVTAFGESAGGGLILHALAAPSTAGLLAGAIVQSGATFATLDDEKAAIVLDTLVKEAGVNEPGDLRGIPAADLVAAQSRAMVALLGTVGMMPFHPMVDGDLILSRPVDAFAAGIADDVALLAGSTSDEMRLFLSPASLTVAPERLQRRVARYTNVDEHKAAEIIAAYARELATDDIGEIWSTLFSDVEMQVPLRAVLDARARATAPTFTYLFTWEGPDVGVCHGIDIPFPFGNFVDGWDEFVGLDDAGRALSTRMRAAWAEFARTGRPGWPPRPATAIFGRELATTTDPLAARLAALN